MILEAIVTTTNADGSVNVSPMGPEVDETMDRFTLKPFQTSTTYVNLKRTGQGVLHVTDDVLLLAQAAVGQPSPPPRMFSSNAIEGWILADACRWYAFRVEKIEDSLARTRIDAVVVERGTIRDFFGFNRAKHAVLEAAILATRLHLLPAEEIATEFQRLAILVDKTGGAHERAAFDFLRGYVKLR